MSDTRFFPGWTWVFTRDPMVGLCYEGTAEEAAQKFFNGGSYWDWNRGKCYTLTGPDADPVEWRKQSTHIERA